MADYLYLVALGVFAVALVVVSVTIRKALKKNKETLRRSALKEIKRGQKRAAASKTVKVIQWGEQFVVDGGVIDQDHKTLFGLINEFNQNIPRFESFDQMVPVLTALKKYTQTHFQREEKLQRLAGYPFRQDHKNEHDAMIEEFDDLVRKAKQADEDTVTDAAVELGSFLRRWLTGHVIENDLPLKAYVKRMREHARGMGGLAQESINPPP